MGRRDMIEQRAIIKPCTVRAASTADFQYMGFSISLHGRLQWRSMAIQAWAFCHGGPQHSYTPLQELKVRRKDLRLLYTWAGPWAIGLHSGRREMEPSCGHRTVMHGLGLLVF